MAEKQANLVTLSLDDDLVSPDYRTLVCEESSDAGVTSSATSTQTKCGTFSAPGTPEGTISGTGVTKVNIEADEISGQQLLDWANNNTKLAAVYQDAADGDSSAGAAVYMAGQGYLSDVRQTSASGDVIKYSFTFTFSGAIDTNPAS